MSCDIIDQEQALVIRRERRITIRLSANKSRRYKSTLGSDVLGQNSIPVFEAGDVVNGSVFLEVNGGQPVAHVKLALVCLSQVRWVVQAKRKSIIADMLGTDQQPNSNQSQIFFDRQSIVNIDLLAHEAKLLNGKHEIPFKMELPAEGLPSTMNSFYGFIKYTVEVFTVDEDQNESRGEKEIVVMAPIEDKLDLPVCRSAEKTFPMMGGAKISVDASLERKGYVPGETIEVCLTTVNNSNVDIQARCSLYQIQTFVCDRVHRTLETCLTTEPVPADIVSAYECQPPNQQRVQLPLATNLVVSLQSALITVRYYVHVSIDIPQHSHDLQLKLPFVVTTKRAYDSVPRNVSRQHSVHSARVPHSPVSATIDMDLI